MLLCWCRKDIQVQSPHHSPTQWCWTLSWTVWSTLSPSVGRKPPHSMKNANRLCGIRHCWNGTLFCGHPDIRLLLSKKHFYIYIGITPKVQSCWVGNLSAQVPSFSLVQHDDRQATQVRRSHWSAAYKSSCFAFNQIMLSPKMAGVFVYICVIKWVNLLGWKFTKKIRLRLQR